MNGRSRLVVALLAVPLLGGCFLFGGEEDVEEPAELVDFDSTVSVRRLWSQKVGGGSEFLRLGLAPASDGARIFAAAYDGSVAAFDAVKGNRLWKVETDLPLSGGPGVGDELLALGSSDGDVVLLEARTGVERWRTEVAGEVLAAPAIASGRVLVRTGDGRLLGLAVRDGSEVWRVEQDVPRLTVRGTAAPVVAGDLVVCGFDNGRLAAYDVLDGTVAWNVALATARGRGELERLVDLNSSVLVVGDDVFVVGYQGLAAGLTVESGAPLWDTQMSSASGMAADWNNLYVTDDNSELIAMRRRGGDRLWQQNAMRLRGLTAPATVANSVVVGDFEGYLHWLDPADGSITARVKTDGSRVSGKPLVVADAVYVLTEAGNLTAFTTTGRE